MLHVPDRLAKKLLPRRSRPGSGLVVDAKSSARTLRAIQRTFEKGKKHDYGTYGSLAAFEDGLRRSLGPEQDARRRAAIALAKDLSEDTLRDADLELLMVVEQMVFQGSLMVPLTHLFGVRTALDVMVGSGRYRYFASSHGEHLEGVSALEEPDVWGSSSREVIRSVLCALPDDAYVEAGAWAIEQRETLPVLRRLALDHAFPDESWTTSDLAEALAASGGRRDWHLSRWLPDCNDVQVLRQFAQQIHPSHVAEHAVELVTHLPEQEAVELFEELLPQLLVKPSYGPLLKTPPRALLMALGCLPSERTAKTMAGYVGHSVLGAVAAQFFQDNPDWVPLLKASSSSRAANAIVAQAAPQEAVELASPEQVPAVLRDRPWRRKQKATTRPVVPGLRMPSDIPESIDPLPIVDDRCFDPHATEASLDEFNRALDSYGYQAKGMLATFGARAIPGVVHPNRLRWLGYEEGESALGAVVRIRSPRAAPTLARAAHRTKLACAAAFAWFDDNVEHTAIGLIPDALCDDDERRIPADEALTHLVRGGHGDVLLSVAEHHYGPEAVEAIAPLINRDPLHVGNKGGKLPSAARLEALPPVRLRGGKALPPDAMDALLEMLRAVPHYLAYPGFDQVAEACEPDDLGALARTLLDQWELSGGHGKNEWMLFASVRFPHDDTTRRLCELQAGWSRNRKARAERGAQALARIGSDRALMQLSHTASSTRFAALKEDAGALLHSAARIRGLTLEELADRTVPDLGLDAEGKLTLDFGDRQFTVSLDPQLALVIRDAEGNRLKSAPRARNTDAPDKAKAAIARYKGLRADLETIAKRQVQRVEQAMVDRRSWSRDDFQQLWVDHPVARHLARGLVWLADHPFRLAEDLSFADLDDEAIFLPDDARVRLAHPLDLGDTLGRWGELFADYELVQPFPQLGRRTFAPAEGRTIVAHAQATPTSPRRLLTMLQSRGWSRTDPSSVHAFRRTFQKAEGPVDARVELDDVLEIAWLDGAQDVRVKTVGAGDGPLDRLDPVVYSEILRDLAEIYER